MRGAQLRSGVYALMLFLGIVTLLALGTEFLTLSTHLLKNGDEGANAYHIAAAAHQPGALYPPLAALFTTHDPPLFFFLSGLVSHFTLDDVIAGRVVAFLSTVGTALGLFAAARLMGAGKLQAVTAAILFLGAPFVIAGYSALNDPNMLGNFLDAIGLVLLLRRPGDSKHIAAAALLLVAALFVQPVFIALPLALLVWLSVEQRRSAALLAGFGGLFLLIGYGVVFFTLHVSLFQFLFPPRLFLWSWPQALLWLVAEALPLTAALLLFRLHGDRFAFLAALYAAAALLLGAIFAGYGVPLTQVAFAVALGASLYLARGPVHGLTHPALGLTALLQGAVLVWSFLGASPNLSELMGNGYAVTYDTLVLKRHQGPVLCESLSLCYWANKPPEADVDDVVQAVLRGARPAVDLTHLFDAHYFSMIQISPGSALFPQAQLWQPLVRNYFLEHQDRNGLFLVPRS